MQEEKGLKKKMGFWQIWALGVGAVVGDGMFLLVASGAQNAGPACIISYIIAGLILMCICMTACELAVGMPRAGSLHDWNKRMLGPRWGMLAAFMEASMNVIFLGSVSLGTGYISNYFFMWTENADISAVIWGMGILAIIFVITMLGGEVTGKAQLGLIIVLCGIMVVFIIAGILSGKTAPENYEPFAPFGGKGIWLAICAGTYAYAGPFALLTTSGEVKKPEILPKAMFWAFLTIIIMYALSMAVCLGLVHYTEYATMDSPFTLAAKYAFGNAAGTVINFAAWIACVTCLVGEMFTVSRLVYGMGIQGVVPKAFGKLNRFGVPHVGLIFSLIVGMVLILMGVIPALGNVYVMLTNISASFGVVAMCITVISSYVYKKKFPDEYGKLTWRLPCRNLFFIVSIVGGAILFWATFSSSIQTVIAVCVYLVILLLFYQFYSKPHSETAEKLSE